MFQAALTSRDIAHKLAAKPQRVQAPSSECSDTHHGKADSRPDRTQHGTTDAQKATQRKFGHSVCKCFARKGESAEYEEGVLKAAEDFTASASRH